MNLPRRGMRGTSPATRHNPTEGVTATPAADTPYLKLFTYIIDDRSRTRRAVALLVAVAAVVALLLVMAAVVAMVAGPTVLAVTGGVSLGGAVVGTAARQWFGRSG